MFAVYLIFGVVDSFVTVHGKKLIKKKKWKKKQNTGKMTLKRK